MREGGFPFAVKKENTKSYIVLSEDEIADRVERTINENMYETAEKVNIEIKSEFGI